MKIHELQISPTPNKSRKGRGISAGQGKTAGRGTKGQNSRTGGKRKPGFEGGQNPLFQRIPKQRGFNSRLKPATVSLAQLSQLPAGEVSLKSLIDAKIIARTSTSAKIVGSSKIDKAYTLQGLKASQGATKLIEEAGGSIKHTKAE